MKSRYLGALLALGLIVSGCAASGTDSVSGEDVTVRMFDNRFEYLEITVPPGGTVTFVGAGRNAHNAVAVDGSWSTESSFGSLEQFNGDEAVVSFNEPGTYEFFCTFHGNADGVGMAATIIVQGGP